MIEADGLCRRFGGLVAVDHLSFRAEPGQVLALLGPNGAGKSTAIRMLAGYLRPTAGSARICGFDVRKEPRKVHQALGYLPEGAPSYDELTVQEFLRFVARMRGLRGEALWDGVDGVVEKLQLADVLVQPIGTLSKGFRRRVGLAQAIIHNPPALMLDEPTDGLDPNQKRQVRHLIDTMARDRTILVSTHLLEEVHALCNRVVIIARGRLLVDATPAELEARSRYHGAVSFIASGAGVARRMLERMAGVAAVELDSQSGRMTVLPRAGHRILEPVQALLREQGLDVAELELERGRLDDVFHSLTTQAMASRSPPAEKLA